MQRSGPVPCSWVTSLAGERDGGDLCGLCRVDCCSDGSGERDLDTNVAADVGACESKFRSGAVPKSGCSCRDSRLDSGDGVGVDVVQAGVGGIGTCCWASARAGGEYTAI